MEMEKSVISHTTESQSSSGAFSLMLPDGYWVLSGSSLFAQKGPSLLIGTHPGICGGAPIILGTRLAVHQIVEQYELLHGDKERLLKAYPHLAPQQLDAAMEYYRDHFEEIRSLIEEEKSAELEKPSAIQP